MKSEQQNPNLPIMKKRNKRLTELSRSPFPSVSYSRNMTGGKQENRVSMMTQIMSNDQMPGAQTFTPWLPLEAHNVKEVNPAIAGILPCDSVPV